jgi:16S rRNA (cytidine1402-2'-O)-methyltransferase
VPIVEQGVLYIVATPIGHLDDISARALRVLAGVQVVAAEDTRHSARLLRHYGIGTPMVAVHEHNERAQAARMLERLHAGEAVALITDAGTPLISDPGFHLVRLAQEAGVRVVPVPGPSAIITALCASGQPVDRFTFEGFLPPRAGARAARLTELAAEPRTLIFFEAPHRVVDTLQAIAEAFGPAREASYCRELTKLHETVRRMPLGELAAWVESDAEQRLGEIVIVVQGAPEVDANEFEARRVLDMLLEELPLKRAAALASRLTGIGKNELYAWGVAAKKDVSAD